MGNDKQNKLSLGGKLKTGVKAIVGTFYKKQSLDEQLLKIIKMKKQKQNGVRLPEVYILNNIMNVKNKMAIDICTPRVDVIAVNEDSDLEEVINMFTKHGLSRLPVYRETLDEPLGFIHVKDLINILRKKNNFVINNIIRQVLFVSPYFMVLDLLYEMIAKRCHMAMVVDEFGGIDGLVTIEDVLEEIVGDINDEYDKLPKKLVSVIKPGYLEADARLPVTDLEQKIGYQLFDEEKEEIDTLGGLITSIVGRVPSKNEIITHPSGIEFEILESDPFKVNKVGVHYKVLSGNGFKQQFKK